MRERRDELTGIVDPWMISDCGLPVVLLTGAPGTGKSTLGRVLAGRLQAALVDQALRGRRLRR